MIYRLDAKGVYGFNSALSSALRAGGNPPAAVPAAVHSTRGQVAQLVEQRTENPCVGGSIPSLATNNQVLTCNSVLKIL